MTIAAVVARTGRDQQRYEGTLRLVSGCIPYKVIENHEDRSTDLKKRIEVAMISSPNRSDLVFPKGGWENDETVEEAACREALEEAGVKGILNKQALGVWKFRSKSRQENCSQEGGCKGVMFALEVTEELDTWPEKQNHERKWLCIDEAFELCRYEWMRDALEAFLQVMKEDQKPEREEVVVVDPTPVVVPDVVAECPIMSASCYKPSCSQHRGICPHNCVALAHIPPPAQALRHLLMSYTG